jgi:1,4-alpha-glucan branching enzyme
MLPQLPFLLLIFVVLSSSCISLPTGPEIVDGSVRFSLHAPQAKSVSIAGTFNQWDPHRDQLSGPDGRGVWSKLLPLPAGRYEYLFIINDETWLPDPGAPFMDDGMGGKNSVLVIEE